MARSRRTSNPVTLFPFLAVLLCTIGALVLMLVVVSAGIRKDAVANAKSKRHVLEEVEGEPPLRETPLRLLADADLEAASAPLISDESDLRNRPIDPEFAPEPLTSPIKEASARDMAEIARLQDVAQKLQAEVISRTRQAQDMSVKTQALQRQLLTVKAQEDDLQRAIIRTANQREKLEQSTSELRVENRQIIEWLDESRKLIDEHQKQLQSPIHSIVPYDGQTGTVRRPIIIECIDDVVRFEAEQVEIPVEVLRKFSPEQNPLSSGVQALFGYWMAKDQQDDPGRRPRKPYALILVRPSGAEAFSSAVFALDEMIGDFGYELVESEFQYELPETTADAVRECRSAIEAELRRGPIRSRRGLNPQGPVDISRVVRGPAASRSFFGSDDFRNRRAGSLSSSAITTKNPGTEESDSLVADNGERVGAGSQRSKLSAGTGQSSREISDSLIQGLVAQGNSLLDKALPPGFDAARAAAQAEAAHSGISGVGEPAELPAGSGESIREEGHTADITTSGQRRSDSVEGRSGRGSVFGKDTSGLQGNDDEGEGDSTTVPPRWLSDTNGRPLIDGVGAGGRGRQGPLSRQGSSGFSDSSGNGQDMESGRRSAGKGDRGAGENGQQGRGPLNRGSASSTEISRSPLLSGSASAASAGGNPGGSGSQNSTSSSSNAPSSSGSSASGGGTPVTESGPRMPTLSRSNQVRSLKAIRRWGLSHPDASLGLEKVVVITVEAGRVVIGNQFQVTRRPELSTAEILNRTMLALDEVAKKWGWPPPKFYWVPSVRVEFDDSEQSLGRLIKKSLEEAGAGLEN